MNWENIPADIFAEIMTYLHGGMILRCTAVCKNWNYLCSNDYIWLVVLGKELNFEKKIRPDLNFKINKEIARRWRKLHDESAKSIYLRSRQRERIPKNLRIFPVTVKHTKNNLHPGKMSNYFTECLARN
jgi:hypothetical protein